MSYNDYGNISDSSLSEKSTSSEKRQYSIYNKNNILITLNDVSKILKEIGINEKPRNLKLWQQSFTHKSYSKNRKKKKNDRYSSISDSDSDIDLTDIVDIQEKSNETLEWLGDGIIQSVVATYLYNRYPGQDEGFLTKTRSKLVKTDSLSKLALFLKLDKFILMSQHVEVACNGRRNSRILEDTFEAFIGAMSIEFINNDGRFSREESYSREVLKSTKTAYDICTLFINNTMEQAIDFTELIRKDDNYKDQLMRYFQKKFNGEYPKYYQDESDPKDKQSGTRRFKMYVCHIEGHKIGEGIARSKKEAEQKAAKNALLHFGLCNGY